MTNEVGENRFNNCDDVAQSEVNAGGDCEVSRNIEHQQPRENFLDYKLRSIRKKYEKSEDGIHDEEFDDDDEYPRNLNPFFKDSYPSELNPFQKDDYPQELDPFHKDDYPSALNPFERKDTTNKRNEVANEKITDLISDPSKTDYENRNTSTGYSKESDKESNFTFSNSEPQKQEPVQKYHIARKAPDPPDTSTKRQDAIVHSLTKHSLISSVNIDVQKEESKTKYNIVRPAPAPPNASAIQNIEVVPFVGENRQNPSMSRGTMQEQSNSRYRISRSAPPPPDVSTHQANVSFCFQINFVSV